MITQPEQTARRLRDELAIAEWLGLDPDDVADVAWRTTEDAPDPRRLCELPPQPEAVITFKTVSSVRPIRWSSNEQSSENPWSRWTLIVPLSELVDVLGRPL